ncbi:MAG: hypothetical protein DMG21_12445 [Acidobacteria bacterium]|nr:MAG: hypothetical protein DMG21_12445 [Acidobacteriota bacterium]
MAFNKAKALHEAEKSLAQGKTSQAIRLYLDIYSKDPTDPTLLNTVGDVYLREKNLPEALRHYHKLAESYTQEGFTIKAIAIYKKISRLDANNVDVLLKTGELYTVQGLGREAREQYTQAIESLRKKNQNDRAVEVFRKIVALDPENAVYRTKFADFCQLTGRKGDAASAYRETAEIALRKGDLSAAEAALAKASELAPQDSKVLVMRARLALATDRPADAEKILTSSQAVKYDPQGQKLLLESYLGTKRLDEAKALVGEVFRANLADFAPLKTFARLCLEKGEYDAAVSALSEASDTLIQRKSTGPLKEILVEIWSREAHHLPTLELVYKIAEKTADESTLPEVLQSLGHAYASAGNLDRAEWAYRKLVEREPENEDYKGLLKGLLQKAGKELPALSDAAELAGGNLALSADIEAEPVGTSQPAAPAISEEEAAMVKEALENSDLFSRYSLTEKAVAELEKVLAAFPEQIEIHSRIIEISRKNLPLRAQQAAEALAKIYARRGDMWSAKRYEAIAGTDLQLEKVAPEARSGERGVSEAPPAARPLAPTEIDLSADFPVFESPPSPAALPSGSPAEIAQDLGAAPASNAPPAGPPGEIDLSDALSTEAALPLEAPPFGQEFNFEESRGEVEFYLERSLVEEARKAVEALEAKFPGEARVGELRRLIESRGPQASAPVATPQPSSEPGLPAIAASSAEVTPAPEGADLLGSLAGDLASSLEAIEGKAAASSSSPARQLTDRAAQTELPGLPASAPSPLSGILAELGEGGEAPAEDDPQTHYDLGVAFREMGLLDEAIGEFQKVVKGAQKGKLPGNFLQACTLLALCFMDKKMPVIAAKWYAKALEIPELDEEATLALLYDLGVAFEQAGNPRTALEKFSEVYSQNIDYRDVAEKVRILQQKA